VGEGVRVGLSLLRWDGYGGVIGCKVREWGEELRVSAWQSLRSEVRVRELGRGMSCLDQVLEVGVEKRGRNLEGT
jgi:hypothetical protein